MTKAAHQYKEQRKAHGKAERGCDDRHARF
jgi:hypothetical protein